jgi:hypothetical protein
MKNEVESLFLFQKQDTDITSSLILSTKNKVIRHIPTTSLRYNAS